MHWNQQNFEDACRTFRKQYPDFKSFERPGERYRNEVRAYKEELVALYEELVQPKLNDEDPDFFDAYLSIMKRRLNSTGKVADMLDWTTIDNAGKLLPEECSQYGQLLIKVVKSNARPDTITQFGTDASELWGSRGRPGEQRDFVSLLLMLHDPNSFMYQSFKFWNHTSQSLSGEIMLDRGDQITAEEYEKCQGLAKKVRCELENAAYSPQDMLDVQSFLHQVYQNKEVKSKWDQRAFESSIAAFKRRYSGFVDFNDCGDAYQRIQRNIKEEFLTLYRNGLKRLRNADPVVFLNAYHELVNRELDSHQPSSLEGWKVLTNEIPDEKKAEFGRLLQSIVNAKAHEWDPFEVYGRESYRLLKNEKLMGDPETLPARLWESATLLCSLHWPRASVHVPISVWNVVGKRFLNREIIDPTSVLNVQLHKALNKFKDKIHSKLKQADLAPTKMFDIQSFLWSIYSESTHIESGDSSDKVPLASDRHERLTITAISQKIRSSGMRIDEATVRQYHFSMNTRGFVILAGPSGVGKTWLTRLYANALNAEYLLAPVAPNWSTNEDLLGFFNPIDDKFHETAFLAFIDQAAESWDRSVSKAKEFHLVLDEMNLARIEHYFSLFLSLMEMRRGTNIPETRLSGNRVVRLPPNLKFAGTVNMDETTHGFADKVFDRAQLIELSISSNAAREHIRERIADTRSADALCDLWERMAPACPVGFRVLDDIADYLDLAEHEGIERREALDEQIVSKLLPKLRGIDPEMADALRQVRDFVNGDFPKAAAKCESMLRRVESTDVVSFF